MMMKNLLNQLLDGKILNKEDMKVVARALFSDEITDSEIAAVLSTLKLPLLDYLRGVSYL